MIWLTPPIHPPTHQTIHPTMCGRVSTDFKSSNRIELSWLVEVLLNFYWFQGSTWGGEWIGVGVGVGVWGHPMQTCTCMHAHVHTCMLNMINMDASTRVAICNFNTCVCACACAHVCGHPHAPRFTPIICPLPKSHREPKTPKFNKSWTNYEIIWFCLKILYLWTLLNSYRL